MPATKKRLNHGAIREQINNRKGENAMEMARLIGNGMRNGEFDLDSVSIRGLYEAFVGPPEQTLSKVRESNRTSYVSRNRNVEEVRSGAFTFATGLFILSRMMSAFEMRQGILKDLVTDYNSSMRTEPIVGFQAFGSMQDVAEGAEYQNNNRVEKVTMNPEPMKRGGKIDITEEVVIFDQTGLLVRAATGIGEALADDEEYAGMKVIQDTTGYKGYYPVPAPNQSAVQTDLFRSAAVTPTQWYNRFINLKATNGLSDWTNVDAALKLFDDMVDEKDRPIRVTANTILVPRALYATAQRIVTATEVRQNTDTGNRVTINGSNIVSLVHDGTFQVKWSPYMNDATAWYIGDFKRQYVNRIIIPAQVIEQQPT